MYDVLLPSFIAGIIAYQVSSSFGITYFHEPVSILPVFSEAFLIKVLLSGLFFGICSIFLIEVSSWVRNFCPKRIRLWLPLKRHHRRCSARRANIYLLKRYLGLGLETVESSLHGNGTDWYAFLLKPVFTSITLSFGGSGGIVTPIFFVGSTAGVAFAHLLNLNTATFAAIGLVSVLAGAAIYPDRRQHHGRRIIRAGNCTLCDVGVCGKFSHHGVVAGNDHTTVYGPTTDFYGNLVVVQLDQTFAGQPVFNLYAHLKSYSVTVGQHVNTGDRLGLVGETGIAIGPHLHFEVRVGANNYAASRNPELWLKPLRYNGVYQGAVAGRVVDTHNQLVSGYSLVIRPVAIELDNPHSRYVTTYTPDGLGIKGDDHLGENFGVTDLPLGTYIIAITTSHSYQQVITVATGSLTWVTFVVEPPPPTATATFTSTVTATP